MPYREQKSAKLDARLCFSIRFPPFVAGTGPSDHAAFMRTQTEANGRLVCIRSREEYTDLCGMFRTADCSCLQFAPPIIFNERFDQFAPC